MDVDPRQNEAEFDAIAVNYDTELNKALSLTGESMQYFAEGRMRWIRRQFEKMRFSPCSAMDFGCGTGNSTPYFFDVLGIDTLTGVDPSEESLEIARANHSAAQAEYFTAAQFTGPGSVDLAFCNGVFHHIPVADRPEAVRFVFEALRPGGLFAFWENNAWNPATRFIMSRTSFDHDAVLVFPHGARGMLREGGFEVLGTDYLFIFPGKLARLRPLERWVSKLPLGGQYLVLARKPTGIQ
jgi:SAM-dependent methyltransferase